MSNLEKMQELLDEAKEDGAKFFNKGNKAAGVRVRKKMQEMKALAQDVRVEITELNKNS